MRFDFHGFYSFTLVRPKTKGVSKLATQTIRRLKLREDYGPPPPLSEVSSPALMCVLTFMGFTPSVLMRPKTKGIFELASRTIRRLKLREDYGPPPPPPPPLPVLSSPALMFVLTFMRFTSFALVRAGAISIAAIHGIKSPHMFDTRENAPAKLRPAAASSTTTGANAFSGANMRFDFHGFFSFCFGEIENERKFQNLLRV